MALSLLIAFASSAVLLSSPARAEADPQPKTAAVLSDDPEQGIAGTQKVSTPTSTVNVAELAHQRDYYPEAATEEESIPEPQPGPSDMPVPPGTRVQNIRATESRPARRAPSAGETESAVESSMSPLPSSSFSALPLNGTSIPPDTQGAVGPNHLMVTLNSQVRFQSRSGNELFTVNLHDFWGADVFDPKLIYDPFNNRWVFVALSDARKPTSSILVAVSANSDPTGNWTLYKIKADDSSLLWADYPSVGFNKNWVVVTVNMFDSTFRYSQIHAINKADLYAGGTIHWTSFQDTLFTEAPALMYDATQPAMYLVTTMNGNSVRISTITGEVGSEVLIPQTAIASIGSSWANRVAANFAPQFGSSNRIDTGDTRMLNVVYRNGSLWCTHNVFLPATAPTRSAVQWWQFQPDGIVQQLGRIDDPSGNIFCAYPSIAVNRNDDVLIGYSGFSAQGYASAAYNYRSGGDAPSRLRDGVLLKAGEAPYFKPFENKNRWGDYSNTVVDPLNDFDMWTIQEYAASPSILSDRWGTWWGRIFPDETPQLDSVPVITNLTGRLAGDVLTLTGTGTDLDGDIVQAQSRTFNTSGGLVGQTEVFNVSVGSTSSVTFVISLPGLNGFPTAVRASLILIDSRTNRSAEAIASFGEPDPGGPNISNAAYNVDGGVLIVKGPGFGDQLQLEVNGVVVAPPPRIKIKGGGTKLKIAGSLGDLNLRNGANRVVIVNGGLRSNIFVMVL